MAYHRKSFISARSASNKRNSSAGNCPYELHGADENAWEEAVHVPSIRHGAAYPQVQTPLAVPQATAAM